MWRAPRASTSAAARCAARQQLAPPAPTPRNAVAAVADRPAGGEGGGRDVRRVAARAGDRGAGARRQGARPMRCAAISSGSSAPIFSKLVPGSETAMKVKQTLIARGVWSQYLEVGIGPDAEIFTKCQPMSSVGYGADVGVLPISEWNNPEPEVALVVIERGQDRRRDARQRRQPARRRGPLGAAARQGQGQQCLGLARAVHPAVRRRASRSTTSSRPRSR